MIQYFLSRTVTTTVCLFLFVGLGIISFLKLKVELFPDITVPTITILTQYPNASIEEMELLVSKPIEEVVASADGVDETFSETMEGISIVKVRLNWGQDIDLSTVLIREKLDLIKGSLPIDVRKPIVLKFDPNDKPIVRIVAFPKSLDFKKLRNFAKKNLLPIFEKANGVATITMSGGHERRILVELDSNRAKSYSLSVQEIQRQLATNNDNIPSGNVIIGDEEYTVRTVGAFKNVDEIERLVVKSNESGIPVILANVAKISDSYKEQTSECILNLDSCVLIDLRKESGKNTVEVSNNIKEIVAEINERFSQELTLNIVEDRSELIIGSALDVASSIILSIVICFLVLTFFTGSWSDAVLITFSIPTSIFLVFLLMHFIGQSLNLLSLGGLAVGIGLMVDSSIVVLESIHKEKTLNPKSKTIILDGVNKIAFALVISNLTSIVVFLPNLYLKGLEGIIFRDFAISVCICLGASLAVSLVFLPFFSSVFQFESGKYSNKIKEISESMIENVKKIYGIYLNRSLNSPLRIVYIGLFSLLLSLFFGYFLSKRLMPKIERVDLLVHVNLPIGNRIFKTSEIVKVICQLAHSVDKDSVTLAKVGYEEKEQTIFPTSDFGVHKADIYIKFNSFSKKNEFEIKLQESEYINQNAKIKVSTKGDILAEVLPFSFDQVSLEVVGSNFADIKNLVISNKALLEKELGWEDIETSFDNLLPEYLVYFDKQRLSSFGLESSEIGNTMRVFLKGDDSNYFKIMDEEIPILIRSDADGRKGIDKIKDINFQIDENKFVMLKDFSEIKYSLTSRIFYRHNGKRVGILLKDIKDESLSTIYNKILNLFEIGKADEIGRITLFGENKKLLDNALGGLGLALLFSIILVYMTLASAMESFILPFLIIFSVFLSAFGVVSTLFIFGESINMMSILGSILLAGIVVNNAILLVEFYRDEKSVYKNLNDLIIAGAMDRLVPILSTTITSLLGLIPLLISLNGSSSQRSLAAAIFGGLAFSTFISLFFIPSVCKILIPKGILEK
ncbi:efflux RND transporter permease subunit [Leptospira jelokensis]|uniref:efflux RND transporter permease subunit n=1 Tax=Leptospira jelokensis TaxID=2484931 RepID=UPI0010916750|nr:efflux RND transporter permease subunit [Leptospira jelokensis]TGM06661.1 efflux RND transporter permease subunit [Leptospira jelokensis]